MIFVKRNKKKEPASVKIDAGSSFLTTVNAFTFLPQIGILIN